MNTPKRIIYPGSDKDVAEYLSILREYPGMTPERLRKALQTPALTPANVQTYLNHCTVDELAQLFYTSGIAKIMESQARQQPSDEKASHAHTSDLT